MGQSNEAELIRNYNKVYGEILGHERRKRQIAREELAYGIMSRTALENVEKGTAGWTKLAGDTMMQRMGLSADYFETLASGEELDRWRLREDICLLVPGSPKEAAEKLEEYRGKYTKREPVEEQFLLKAEAILAMIGEHEDARWLPLSLQAVRCTVPEGWYERFTSLWLAPGELEAILLVGAALLLQGRKGEAWGLQQAVWKYPEQHGWKECQQALILPQAAILGMKLGGGTAFSIGKKALELLRRNCYQCYLLPLLEGLCGLPVAGSEEVAYQRQAQRFLGGFREIYQWAGCPGNRIWQGVSVDNTREAGTVLKMLRKFYGKPRVEAVYDGEEQIITEGQLEKVEKGVHKPSYGNYNRLVKQYGKYGGWNMPLLETESADVLELRQEISTLIEFEKWEEAEWKLERLRGKVDTRYPKARQEILFFDGLFKWEKERALEESLDMMFEALHCTVPDFVGKDMKWWVYQQEEIMLATDIASLYRRLGQLDEAKKWFEAVIFSIEQQCRRTGIRYYGYDMLRENYDNLLGDTECFGEAIKMNEETAQKILMLRRINGVQSIFYRIAWNSYQYATKKPEEHEILRRKWRKAFCISGILADFMLDYHLKAFLDEQKYLL